MMWFVPKGLEFVRGCKVATSQNLRAIEPHQASFVPSSRPCMFGAIIIRYEGLACQSQHIVAQVAIAILTSV